MCYALKGNYRNVSQQFYQAMRLRWAQAALETPAPGETFTDRASNWRKRALEKAEEDWRAGKKLAYAATAEDRKKKFRDLIAGPRPYKLWNHAFAFAAEDAIVGPHMQAMQFGESEIKHLVPLSDAAIDENIDWLFEWFGIISPSMVFAGTILPMVALKAYAARALYKAAKEQKSRPRLDPSRN